jgi:GDP-D-mannose dehydratase
VAEKEIGSDSSTGRLIVRVGARYLGPGEVESLLSDASNARQKAAWKPETSFSEFVHGMARPISRLLGVPRSFLTIGQKNRRFL